MKNKKNALVVIVKEGSAWQVNFIVYRSTRWRCYPKK
jgi:hypothetical protein